MFTAEVNVICTGNPAMPVTSPFLPRTPTDPDGTDGGISGPPPFGVTTMFPFISPPISPN